MEKKRYKELTVLNFILCFFVVFIHTSTSCISDYREKSFLQIFFYFLNRAMTFVVPGFLFLSAVKASLTYDEKSFKYLKFLGKKIKNVYLPYVIISAMFFFIYAKLGYYAFDLKYFLSQLLWGRVSYHLYYIPLLMQFFIFFPLVNYLFKKFNNEMVLVLSVLFNICYNIFFGKILIIFGLDAEVFNLYKDRILLTYFFVWIFGQYVGYNYEKYILFINKHIKIISFSYFFFVIYHILHLYLQDLNLLGYYNNINTMIFWVLSIIMFLYISQKFSDTKFFELSKYFSKSTYYIYLIHPIFIFVITNNFHIESVTAFFVEKFFVVYALCFIINLIVELLHMSKKMIKEK